MKHNLAYQKLSLSPTADPTPMTVEGTHALTERYYALKRIHPKSIVNGFSLHDHNQPIREIFSISDPSSSELPQ